MPVEKIKLAAKFKIDITDTDESIISEIRRLLTVYREVVNHLIDYAHTHQIVNYIQLRSTKYHELREKHPTLPAKYIVCACRHAIAIYKSFIRHKRMRLCKKEKPIFKKRVAWLQKKLFKLNIKDWKASIAVCDKKWITVNLHHGKYHEKFRGMEVGEAVLKEEENGNLYLCVTFRKTVALPEISANAKVIAVDVNENVIVYGNDDFVERFETNEGIIRTRYFLKRRKIQSKVRGMELRRKLLEKYRGREWQRVREIYYKAAKKIIDKAIEVGATVIVMEDLRCLNEGDKDSKDLNGRLHRWSYRRFHQILEYQAKLHGLNVKYVDPAYTSKTCPVCGGELDLSPNGRRLMRCQKCGLEEDRDVIAVRNITRRYYQEFMNLEDKENVGSPRFP